MVKWEYKWFIRIETKNFLKTVFDRVSLKDPLTICSLWLTLDLISLNIYLLLTRIKYVPDFIDK